tara:strand:+ start:213 stop:383 length:171 start_codon:yes stop_codon:yes gene_type:complete
MLIDQFRAMLALKEFHVVVEKGKIWLYFWRERSDSRYLHKEPFDDWGEVFKFTENF